jgi:hypothetical protein
MSRRIDAIGLMQPAMDENYRRCVANFCPLPKVNA